MNNWIVLLPPIIFVIAVVLSICEIFRTCNKKGVSNEHAKLIIVLASLVMASPFILVFFALVFCVCAYCLCVNPPSTRLAYILGEIAGEISVPFFLIVHSVVGTWLATKLHYIFKNPWAALVAYIFPPIAIIAALLPRRNVED